VRPVLRAPDVAVCHQSSARYPAIRTSLNVSMRLKFYVIVRYFAVRKGFAAILKTGLEVWFAIPRS
jgi:hypothetical protein